MPCCRASTFICTSAKRSLWFWCNPAMPACYLFFVLALCAVCTAAAAGGLARALQGVKSVIALGRLGALLPAAQRAGVERVVLLSTAGEG